MKNVKTADLNPKLNLPLLKIPIEDSAWKSFPADPNSLQDAVAAELVYNQLVFDITYVEQNNYFSSQNCILYIQRML